MHTELILMLELVPSYHGGVQVCGGAVPEEAV